MSELLKASIDATLKAYPLCRDIALFLLEHENAMDTVRGIADCWVQCDKVAVQNALDRLIACGLVSIFTLSSGTLYGLTRSAEIREWLRSSLLPSRKDQRHGSNGATQSVVEAG
jgi:hypothetical protein